MTAAATRRDPRSGRYLNPIPSAQPNLLKVLAAFVAERGAVTVPREPIQVEKRVAADFDAAGAAGARVTWLGHSTLILELEGTRLLVDPVWAERASPVQWAGPRRFFAPPLALDELPHIDAVLLSHDHFDHLDKRTVQELGRRGLPFIVPEGVDARLVGWGIAASQIRAVRWWDRVPVGTVEVVSTPARHFSGRSALMLDRDRALWSGYALIGRERRLWYAGDTAWFGGFSEIGERLGPFDISMIEIGAYSHLWPDVHIGPEQAVEAHLQARGGLLLPIHWGTFDLAMHGWTEPIERLLVAAQAAGVPVATPRPGGMVTSLTTPRERWWPDERWRTVAEYPLTSSGR